MLIEIDKSLIEDIKIKKDKPEYKDIIELLDELAESYRKNKHIIIADIDVLEYLGSLTDLSPKSRSIYNLLCDHVHTDYYSLKKQLKIFIKIVGNNTSDNLKVTSGNQEILNFPIEFIKKFKEFRKTLLITEDIEDSRFYISLTQKYIDYKKINDIDLAFDKNNGGGNNTYKSVEDEINERFILCILDSDKKYKNDKIGQTARNVKRFIDKDKPNSLGIYIKDMTGIYILDVREKENLIPPSFYKLCSNGNNKDLLQILSKLEITKESCNNCTLCEELLKYGDLKDGTKLQNYLKIDDAKKIFNCHPQLKNNDIQPILECSCNKDYSDDDLKKIVIPGIGESCTKYFENDILKNGLVNQIESKKEVFKNNPNQGLKERIQKLEQNYQISQNLFDKIPEYIQNDLIQLCDIILAWGCSTKFRAI